MPTLDMALQEMILIDFTTAGQRRRRKRTIPGCAMPIQLGSSRKETMAESLWPYSGILRTRQMQW